MLNIHFNQLSNIICGVDTPLTLTVVWLGFNFTVAEL